MAELGGAVTGAFERVGDLVAQGELQAAIEFLGNLLRGSGSSLHSEAVLLAGRAAELRRRERAGLMTDADAQVQATRLGQSVLELKRVAEQTLAQASLPVPSPSADFAPPSKGSLEKIWGPGHLRRVAWVRRGLEASRSVGRVITPEGTGTGFFVQPGYLLTNEHVVGTSRIARASVIELNFEEDSDAAACPRYRYAIDGTWGVFDRSLDFALLRVLATDASMPTIASWGVLSVSERAGLSPGEHVSIIQHPQGGPKQIAMTKNEVVNVWGHLVQYTTDTLPGSSGSPVFADDWTVIALHHAGGHLRANAAGDRMFVNEGVSLVAIVAELRLRGIDLSPRE